MCVAGVRTYVFNLFVSSAKCARLQRETRLSPAPEVFVSSAKSVRLRTMQHKTRSTLAMNAFVGSVMSCSEVSSRGYLVASDQHVVCSVTSNLELKRVVFESWFRNPPKRTETRGKKVLKKTSFRVGMEL